MEWIYTLLRLLSTHWSSLSLITLTKVDTYTLRGKLRRMNWYPVEFIEGCAVHECLHSWTLALGSLSCLVLSFHVDPSAEFPAFRPHLCPLSEHLQQYTQNLRPSLTCTVRAWLDSVPEGTPGGELGKQNCTEKKVDRDGWSCHTPPPRDYPSFRTQKHILDDHWSQATLVRGRSLCKVASFRLLNGS